MRVLLKLTLDCTPDAAWTALRSPAVFRQVSSPFTTFESLDDGGFPESWTPGDHRVEVRGLGIVPLGEQSIRISTEQRGDVRLVHDTGGPISGPLTMVTRWHHTMAVSPGDDGGTLYRDRLEFSAGPLTPLVWVGFWAFWQWRALQLQRLAPGWR